MIQYYIKLIVFSGLLLQALFCFGADTKATSGGIQIQNWKTPTGVLVYFVARPEIPMLDIAVVFAAGSARDQKKWGLAHFTGSMLDEGTATQSAIAIAEGFDQVGAELTLGVDRDMATLRLRSMTELKYFTPALQLFMDVLSHPSFPESSFLRVKQQLLDNIRQNLQDPSRVADEAFYKNLYGDQPYGHPIVGSLATIDAIQLSDIKNFYHKFYVNGNAKIVLVGAVSLEKAHEIAAQIASGLLKGNSALALTPAVQISKDKKVFVAMPVSQNSIMIGANAIKRGDPDYFNLLVANHVFGGLPMTSLLFKEVRNEKGLAYSVYSGFMPLQLKGPFIILLQTRSTMSQQAIDLVQKTLADYLAKGPTVSELSAAKLNLIGGFPLKISSNRGVLANVINIAFYGLPLDYLQTYPQKISAVSIEEAKSSFNKIVQLPLLDVVVAGAANNH